jgi:hypothetical protein
LLSKVCGSITQVAAKLSGQLVGQLAQSTNDWRPPRQAISVRKFS